ncbi:MAG: hypothetical protein LLG05_12535 [Porphyromonadaceae bacterium]|nr:hypothetical protein [Porphyromonadaceae bacterium]
MTQEQHKIEQDIQPRQGGGARSNFKAGVRDTLPLFYFGIIKAILVIMLLLPSSVYGFDRLNKSELALEGSWLALHTVDYGQTLSIAKNPLRYYERNLILGRHPSEGEVHGYMIATALLHPVVTYLLPREVDVFGIKVPIRFIWQGVSIGVSGTCVVNNASIGLRIGF